MNPANSDSDEPLLTSWLREAAEAGQCEGQKHVANVRRVLLERLETTRPTPVDRPNEPPAMPLSPAGWLPGIVARHHFAAGGLALSTLLLAALALITLNSTERLSAMERTAKELRAVNSYSYRLRWQSTWLEDEGKRRFTTSGDGNTYWSAPEAFHSESKILKRIEEVSTGKASEEVLEHFAEIFPVAHKGVLIDFLRKTFIRISFDPTGSKTYPWDVLRMIREHSYDVQRELGHKQIDGVNARGFILNLKNPRPNVIVRDPVELWVNAETDLPIEFSYGGSNEGSTYVNRATDFRWNTEVDPQLFKATPPTDCNDITPPDDPRDLAQIGEALRLYAQLSRGTYPQAKEFRAAAIRDEMLKFGGFSEVKKPEWTENKSYQQIEQAVAGLNWIERILRIRHLSGYKGAVVGPADRDKVLLWWATMDGRYQVLYGDLRLAILSEAEWSQLVPEAKAGQE